MEQITIAEWQQWKQDIKEKLNSTVENFIVIGLRLRQIYESEGYKNDGYTNFSEFVKEEFDISDSTATRFMAISKKYTVGGNGTELLPEFKGIGYSKLQEMLSLSDADCRLITANTTVKEIRELKSFNHADISEHIMPERQQSSRTALQECIWDFFSAPGNRELLDEVLAAINAPSGSGEVQNIADTISPSGNRTHRKGIVFLFMYDYGRGVAYKLMTSPVPVKLTWEEFLEEIRKTYADYMAFGGGVWEAAYGSLPESEQDIQIPGQMDISQMEPDSGRNPDGEKPENVINPKCGGHFKQTGAGEIENITGQAEIVAELPKNRDISAFDASGTEKDTDKVSGTEGTNEICVDLNKGKNSISGKPENVINPKCGGHFDGQAAAGINDGLINKEELAETWLRVADSAEAVNDFVTRYEIHELEGKSISPEEIKEAYRNAIALAAGIEKLLILSRIWQKGEICDADSE